MKKNVGNIDKIARVIIAIAAAYFAYNGAFGATMSYVLYAVAGIMLLTSLIGSCPIYSILGQSTSKTN